MPVGGWVGDYKKLEVWQIAHELVCEVYEATRAFPRYELFGLTAQLRRAAVSTAANLVEGCGRSSDPELRRFARIALGSAAEVEYYLLLVEHLELLAPGQCRHLAQLTQRVRSMLARLQHALPPGTQRSRRIADSG
jgi:four helix bundle protein